MSDTDTVIEVAKRLESFEQLLRNWKDIAKATTRAVQQSVSVRTAQRWARPGRALRLPVSTYPNRRVYMRRSHLIAFAVAFLDGMPTGGKPPGHTMADRGIVRRRVT